jgi:hypothetical protein
LDPFPSSYGFKLGFTLRFESAGNPLASSEPNHSADADLSGYLFAPKRSTYDIEWFAGREQVRTSTKAALL